MEIGISLACFYPMEPENVVSEVLSLKIKACEIFLNTQSELDEEYLYSLREKCDEAGLRIHSIHPFTSAIEHYMFFSPYPRRIKDSMEFYRQYAKAAGILGASVVNIHGDRGVGLQNFDRYVELVSPLLQLQEQTGIIFSLENVYYNSVNCPEFVDKLKAKLPDVRFTLDLKQAHKGGEDPYLLAEAMGSSIVNFHVNDFDDCHLCMLPGQGSVDYKRLFEILGRSGYDGPALIEVYRDNFSGVHELEVSKKYLETELMLAK